MVTFASVPAPRSSPVQTVTRYLALACGPFGSSSTLGVARSSLRAARFEARHARDPNRAEFTPKRHD